jgi:biotin/methionine sulfoxide reductase
VRQWLAHLYAPTAAALRELGKPAPSFEEFWAAGELVLPQAEDDGGLFRAFRQDPRANALRTPSGKIQITSPVLASFDLPDCRAHPSWFAPTEPPNEAYPLWLVANQPATRLHSQLDFGACSAEAKRQGREVCTLHPAAAAPRGIREGDIVRLFNERGACLASATLSEDMLPDVVRLPTGAWFDPATDAEGRPLCVHGNPNVLTRDLGTSSLAQGCTGQLTRVQVEPFRDALPPLRAHLPPGGAPQAGSPASSAT